ncbi:MAG: GNAT family N-acetyltransferase [Oscillospiraceae bacterium]|nr:GNAT family N-acetyltransferase [Oscillospiraceae bacterium]
MNIRFAEQNDVEQVAKLVAEYRAFYGIATQEIAKIVSFINERMDKNESIIFVAEDIETATLLGFIQLYPSFSTVSLKPQWILNDFYVVTSQRKKGIGSALMASVVKFFEDKAKGFILVTGKNNHTAKYFYDKHGWSTGDYDFYTYTY